MAVKMNALIKNAGNLASYPDGTVANIAEGAQLGHGSHLPDIDAATPLTFNSVIPIVTHLPTMFDNQPDVQRVLKAVMERHPKGIDGVDFEYSLEVATTAAGKDSQMISMPTQATRSSISPSFTFQEVTGNLIWNLMRHWLTTISNPDTQQSFMGAISSGDVSPAVFSSFSMDMMFIQFDSTFRPENILDAIMVTAMFPTSTGMLNIKSSPGQVELAERTIPFTGVLQHNLNTKRVAMDVAEIIGMHRVDYNTSVPIASKISSKLNNQGIQAEVAKAVKEFGDMA